jgi:cytochrome P450
LGYPFIGETLSFFLNPSSYGKQKQDKFGDTYTENTIALGVVLGNHVDISWLWNSERKGRAEGMWPPHIRSLLGKGAVANTSGQRHRMLRRMLEHAFAPNATRDYVQVLDQATQDSLQTWATSDDFHSSGEFKMFALRLFFIAGFGSVNEEMMHQLHDDFTIWLNGFGSLLPLRIPGTLFDKAMRARERILETVQLLVRNFKHEFPPESERAQKSMMGRICYGTDEEGNPMDSDTLNDNVLNMIFAGHDTTYASMGTALHYLSERGDILDALTKEVQSFQEPLSFDELKNAPLLNAFLAESWRMDPPVAGAFRRLKKDTEYKGYKLFKEMVIRYNILAASQNEALYPTPAQFEIQRYLPKDHPRLVDTNLEAHGVDYNNLKANYPIFGGGAHGCLGSHFAKLEMRVLLTRLLQSYNLEVRNSEKVHFPVNGWKNEFKLTKK